MKSAKSMKDWTTEELLAELRFRERKEARTKSRGRDGGRKFLHDTLRTVPTRALLKTVQDRQRVIYGIDNRKDLYQIKKPAVRRAADAVVALVKTTDLKRNADGTFTLKTENYQAAYNLCGNEPFASQPLGCFCSGFLVAPDAIATAGHCVKSQADLARIRFVFSFDMLNSSTARISFSADDVYSGTALIGRQQVEDGPDWALVRLDRPVVNRQPLTVRSSGKISNQQKIFVIGHPNGLPTKYADGAAVRNNDPSAFFVANLDTYGGNSGSPVYNRKTLQVEGILVRGENDFVSNGGCQVSLVCPTTGCRGEDVTRSTVWAGKITKGTGRRAGGR